MMVTMPRAIRPRPGDLLLRGNVSNGFVVVDALTREPISRFGLTLQEALAVAQTQASATLWQQLIDDRGRPLGEPFLAVMSLR